MDNIRRIKQKIRQVTAVWQDCEFCCNFTLQFRKKYFLNGKYTVTKFATSPSGGTLPTRRRKDSDTENDRENGLRMKNEMIMKEKRFSFFADPQERKAESRPTFGTLPFARHTSQRFAKVKEPNLADTHRNSVIYICLT